MESFGRLGKSGRGLIDEICGQLSEGSGLRRDSSQGQRKGTFASGHFNDFTSRSWVSTGSSVSISAALKAGNLREGVKTCGMRNSRERHLADPGSAIRWGLGLEVT